MSRSKIRKILRRDGYIYTRKEILGIQKLCEINNYGVREAIKIYYHNLGNFNFEENLK